MSEGTGAMSAVTGGTGRERGPAAAGPGPGPARTGRYGGGIRLVIRSGGQTGADRAGLDAAVELGLTYRGWVPRGGLAEDHPDDRGLLDDYPLLTEDASRTYPHRTWRNVAEADGVVIITPDGRATSPGSRLTATAAERTGTPYVVARPGDVRDIGGFMRRIAEAALADGRDEVDVDIAGTRGSKAPGLYDEAKASIIRAVTVMRAHGLVR